MATYRGALVESVEFSRKDDTYLLINGGGEVLAILKRHEFLSHPQLRTLKVNNGKHRRAAATFRISTPDLSSFPWGSDPIFTGIDPGANAASTLTAADLARANRWLMGEWQEKPKPALKRDGMVAGEIIGYRCWRVEKGMLRSVYQNDVWAPRQILEGREIGDWDQRGIHAWKDGGSTEYHNYIRGYLNRDSDPFRRLFYFGQPDKEPSDPRPAMVTGTVFLWGDVVEHERGWRAEYARARSLDWLYPDASMMGREQEALDNLRRRYAVPLHERKTP